MQTSPEMKGKKKSTPTDVFRKHQTKGQVSKADRAPGPHTQAAEAGWDAAWAWR